MRISKSVFWRSGSVVLAVSLLLAGLQPASSHPASLPFWGPTGLGIISTTDTVTPDNTQIDLDYERVKPSINGHVTFFPVLSGTYGLKRGEVGIGYSREKDSYAGPSGTYNDYTIHGKYRLFQSKRTYGTSTGISTGTGANGEDANESVPDSAVAIGAQYIKFGGGYGHLADVYLTGNKVLMHKDDGSQLLRAHAGVIYQQDRRGEQNAFLGDQNVFRPFVGVDYKVSPKLTLAGDYIIKRKESVKAWSVVGRYAVSDDVSAQLGYGHFGSTSIGIGRDDKRFMASVAYTFDKK